MFGYDYQQFGSCPQKAQASSALLPTLLPKGSYVNGLAVLASGTHGQIGCLGRILACLVLALLFNLSRRGGSSGLFGEWENGNPLHRCYFVSQVQLVLSSAGVHGSVCVDTALKL